MSEPFLERVDFRSLRDHVTDGTFWHDYLGRLTTASIPSTGIHVAVFVEPFLTFLLEGRKTVESRFGLRRRSPYQTVLDGDIILVKRSAGPIVGVAAVRRVWFYRISSATLNELRETFAERLCANDDAFWDARRGARFATMIELCEVSRLRPMAYGKRDRRDWVTLTPRQLSMAFRP